MGGKHNRPKRLIPSHSRLTSAKARAGPPLPKMSQPQGSNRTMAPCRSQLSHELPPPRRRQDPGCGLHQAKVSSNPDVCCEDDRRCHTNATVLQCCGRQNSSQHLAGTCRSCDERMDVRAARNPERLTTELKLQESRMFPAVQARTSPTNRL